MRSLIYMLSSIIIAPLGGGNAQRWELGAQLAATGFMGDINPTNPLYMKSVGGGMHLTYNFNPTWGIQSSYHYIHLKASDHDSNDPYRYARRQYFDNNVHELSFRANFNFFRFIAGGNPKRYTPYLFAGLAGFAHTPYIRLENGVRYSLPKLKLQEDNRFKKIGMAVPFGFGFKYNMQGSWSIGAEIHYRVAFNDYLDNISNRYPIHTTEPTGLPTELYHIQEANGRSLWQELAFPAGNIENYAGKKKGNSRAQDGYMTAGVTVSYTLISRKCNWWN
ncbi:type IX secretion system protein PorG [Sphingobacterium suaedae]|uniref:DUF6089 family protein n=1 Tax=Sphingobacterium suaedae TaxID=1686402 RepID=A0ABW5KD46_9SPHI